MLHQPFDKGDQVEVLKRENDDNDGVVSIWFPATVLRSSSSGNHRKNKIYVEFQTLTTAVDDDDDKPSPLLREYVDIADVRPAPAQELYRFFKVGETVEAFCNYEGWRKGTVLNILKDSKYAVSFSKNTTDTSIDDGERSVVEEVEQWGLRVFRVWDDGSWVPPLQLQVPSLIHSLHFQVIFFFPPKKKRFSCFMYKLLARVCKNGRREYV